MNVPGPLHFAAPAAQPRRMDEAVPSTLGARAADAREATRDLWGTEAVRNVLAALPAASRPLFEEGAVNPRWVPVRAFVDYMVAVWEGPAARDPAALRRWAERINQRGFGTARRWLLGLASPWLLLRRSQALWRAEHTHGRLNATPRGPRGVTLTLSAHPFTEHEVSRAAISEALRCIVFLCRVRDVTESHRLLPGGELEVTLDWR